MRARPLSISPRTIPFSWLLCVGTTLAACGGDSVAPSGTSGTTELSTNPSSGSESGSADASTADAGPSTGSDAEAEGTSSSGVDATAEGPSTSATTDETSSSGGDETDTSTGDRPACGDGIVDADEACDDVGESASCNADCSLASCGDGVVNATAGEDCDDAGPSPTCDLDCSPAVCGDGVRNDLAGEQCDGLDLAFAGCLDAGFGDGELACGAACDLDSSGCAPAAPVLELSFSQVKRFDFDWQPAPGAEYYLLFERAAPDEELVQLGAELFGIEVSVPRPLVFRFDASYVLRACNDHACTDSAEIEVNDSLAEAIGYFKASNTASDDLFGRTLAISGDGRTLAVAATGEDSASPGIDGDQSNNDLALAGAVYVFVRDDEGEWSQQAYVKASNPQHFGGFGLNLAISDDGDTLVVGTPNEDSGGTGVDAEQGGQTVSNSGAVYVFVRDDADVWSQSTFIKASNAEISDQFGEEVALSGDGDTLVVGAFAEDGSATALGDDPLDNGLDASGAVYVYERDDLGEWSQQAYLKASNANAGDSFGDFVAISGDGDTLAAAATQEASGADGIDGDQTDESSPRAGAVYVFVRVGGVWSQQAYVKASNSEANDFFGPVALNHDGHTLAVSAASEDSSATGIDGDGDDNGADASGAVYVFVLDAQAQWSQQAYVKASNTGAGDGFYDLVINASGDVLVVGAGDEDSGAIGIDGDQLDESTAEAGAAYVFVRDALGAWSQAAYVKAANTQAAAYFGRHTAVSDDGETVVVGAALEDGAAVGIGGDAADQSVPFAGAVYVY